MQMIQNQCLSDSESVQLLNSPPPPPPPSNSKIVNDSFSGTRFKTDIIGAMYFKSNKIEQYYTSFIIWIKSRNRPRYGTLLTEISKLGYAIPCDEVKRRKKTGWIKTTN